MIQGPFLLIVSSGSNRETYSFSQDMVSIGRSRDCDLCINERVVSRHHCHVERIDGSFFLVDDGGQNKVRYQGAPVERAELQAGDSFMIGNLEIELALPAQQPGTTEETYLGEGVQSVQDMATFMTIARALNEEQDLTRLLTLIVDSAIQLICAERGFLILGKGTETRVEVARNFAQEEVLSPEFKISRTIAQRVLESGVPELTLNAQEDERFRDLASVADLRLRSVLCMPIRIRGEVVGVLYVDNRLQQQAFHQRERDLMSALADHAGVAIHNARTMEELRARQVELQGALDREGRLNATLQGQVSTQQAELSQMRNEMDSSLRSGRYKHDYSLIVGESRRMGEVFALLDKYVEADDPVLILGESGTGKELVARAIHSQSARRKKSFVSENCAAMPEALLESELFGYVRGAFTGATSNKKGLFEAADGGVLFLDEIGDLPLDLQKKLLRVLQEGEVRPVGSSNTVTVDVRLVTATNRNLEDMIREADFREDLYYRINVLPITLPPLRERRQDVPLLVRRFLAALAKENNFLVRISPDAMDALVRYRWPGNVRELQNEIRRAALLSDGVILESHLSELVRAGLDSLIDSSAVPAEKGTNLPDMVRNLEMREIEKAYRLAKGNKSRAAEMLGLSRFALQRKLDKYQIIADQDETETPQEAAGEATE
ncbi:MAG: sigma 54-interacting transcriptional regulator [Planctomycetota bacterium]|jgi:transcriptional regulator with GAF, ATPase, and Fis domain